MQLSPLVHFGAVVADAPSPLSTPRTRRQGKPRRSARGSDLAAVNVQRSKFAGHSATTGALYEQCQL